MYTNMEEVQPFFDKIDKTYWKSCEQPTLKQLDHKHENVIKSGPSFTKWFHTRVDDSSMVEVKHESRYSINNILLGHQVQ
jgi:hypothetical protein